jgi:paraquat-inducible protein B
MKETNKMDNQQDDLLDSDALVAQAVVQPMNTVSRIWIVPIVTALLGIWMIFYYYNNLGPLITIELAEADGLEAKVTKIKIRDVEIGQVESIKLKASLDGVLIKARISKDAKELLVSDAKFWVVSTKVSHSGVSDLNTLFSGNYIEMQPGKSTEYSDYFTGLNERPITDPSTPGMHLTLNSDDEFAFDTGAPIFYKGLKVGQIEDVYFNFDERVVYYNAFIKAPYHKLITTNTRFWDISGIRVDLKAQGISVKTGSLESLITNGITFGIPEGMPTGESITERTYFDIFSSYEKASEARYQQETQYVLLVEDTVRGLNIGAPVEYRGVTIGKVNSAQFMAGQAADTSIDEVKIPVVISIQPGRIGLADNTKSLAVIKQQMNRWLAQGLKARITTGNILTGSKVVELHHASAADKSAYQETFKAQFFNDLQVIPTEADNFSQLAEKTSDFVTHLADLPLDDLANNANVMLSEFSETAKLLQNTASQLDTILTQTQQKGVISQLNITLEKVATVAEDFSAGSKNYQQLAETLSLLQENLHELKPLLRQLNNKPNSLIFTGEIEDDLQPMKIDGGNKSAIKSDK